ncbi:MAG TPA: transglycosylase family protein [Solirubrobacterales bacterium]|nr:transglycosylase family protein [Solirubrobacterales bacterium]
MSVAAVGAVAASAAAGDAKGESPARLSSAVAFERSAQRFRRTIHAAVAEVRAADRAIAAKRRRERFAALPGGVTIDTLEAIASCESGGDPTVVSSDGTYRGKYQFDQGTWESVGGHGDPAAAPEAEQDYRAALLYSRSGSSPWPVCG